MRCQILFDQIIMTCNRLELMTDLINLLSFIVTHCAQEKMAEIMQPTCSLHQAHVSAKAGQMTGSSIVYSTVCSSYQQRKKSKIRITGPLREEYTSDQGIPLAKEWWRHQMEKKSALLAFNAGNSPVTGEFPTQRPVTRSFDVFFGLRLNKQSWG